LIYIKRNAFTEDKRRLEAKIAQMEEELEDEQNTNEQTNEKLRKLQTDNEKLNTDLHVERANASKAEVYHHYF
jgi:peptidoglycan hydrolase CwlO-like protein